MPIDADNRHHATPPQAVVAANAPGSGHGFAETVDSASEAVPRNGFAVDHSRMASGVGRLGAAALDVALIDRAAVPVANVLHTPMTDLLDARVDDVLAWA